MKKIKIVSVLACLFCWLTLTGMSNNNCGSNVKLSQELYKIRATCYTSKPGKVTATGTIAREGILAGSEENFGNIAILYAMNDDGEPGEIIGTFVFEDTGPSKGLKSGSVIDVYRESHEGIDEWIDTYGDYVYIRIIEVK